MHENLFEKILWSEYLFAFGLVVFAVVEWFICSAHSTDMYAVYGKMGYIMQMSVKYIGTYLLVSMFYRNSDLFERDSIIAKSLCFWANAHWMCTFCTGFLFHLFLSCMFM